MAARLCWVDNMNQLKQFIFGGDTGDSYEAVRQKRALSEQLAARVASAAPRNIGEGLHSIGNALASRRLGATAATAEDAGRENATTAFQALLGGRAPQSSGVTPSVSTRTAPQSAPSDLAAFNASLARTESGGDLNVRNSEGYTGRYQFGQARLDDFNRANGTQYSTDDLRGNEGLTEAVQAWHVGDIDSFIERSGLDQFEGQVVGGVPITRNGMRAMAHLGGNGGMKRFLESGGQYDPADSNGTNLSDYARTHGQVGGQAAQPSPQRGVNPDMVALMDNPYLTDGQRGVLGMLMQQQVAGMAPQQPMSELEQVQLEQARLNLEQDRNPQSNTPEFKIEELSDGRKYYVDPTGQQPPRLVNDAIDPASAEKPLTEGQARMTLFQSMQTETAPVLTEIEKAYDPSNIQDAAARRTPIGGNFFQTEAGQQYTASASAWVEGALRLATGAAATPEEFERTLNTYFARPGDTPATIQFKAQLRSAYSRTVSRALGQDVEGSIELPAAFAEQQNVTDYSQMDEAGITEALQGMSVDQITPEQRQAILDRAKELGMY